MYLEITTLVPQHPVPWNSSLMESSNCRPRNWSCRIRIRKAARTTTLRGLGNPARGDLLFSTPSAIVRRRRRGPFSRYNCRLNYVCPSPAQIQLFLMCMERQEHAIALGSRVIPFLRAQLRKISFRWKFTDKNDYF